MAVWRLVGVPRMQPDPYLVSDVVIVQFGLLVKPLDLQEKKIRQMIFQLRHSAVKLEQGAYQESEMQLPPFYIEGHLFDPAYIFNVRF
jgi:hypothetical protein